MRLCASLLASLTFALLTHAQADPALSVNGLSSVPVPTSIVASSSGSSKYGRTSRHPSRRLCGRSLCESPRLGSMVGQTGWRRGISARSLRARSEANALGGVSQERTIFFL
ncbi:hypothetical protein B0H13DRAFT_2564401 [Mycena leptocephala]|nr:hypothetical protein B0H13DRAFT_2564401 [Mycena leptocephala]